MYDGSRANQSKIQLGELTDVNYWTRELAVSEHLLRFALSSVGGDEVRVRSFLLQRALAD
jgi:hypothetical protein